MDATADDDAAFMHRAQGRRYQCTDWRKDNCRIAIQNLDILENAGRISQDDGQGGKRLMTEEEKDKKVKAMRAQKEKYCEE